MKKQIFLLLILFLTTGSLIAQNTGLWFDGEDDYVTVDDHPELALGSSDFTLEAWISAEEGYGDFATILSKRTASQGFWWVLNSDGSPVLWVEGNWYDPKLGMNLFDEECHHLVVVRESNKLYFYVDTKLSGSKSVSGNLSSSAPLWMGMDPIQSESALKGTIEEVRMWNRALDAEEIISYFQACPPSSQYLVAYWPMSEGQGQCVSDVAQYNNVGQRGATEFSDSQDPEWVEARCVEENCCDSYAYFEVTNDDPLLGEVVQFDNQSNGAGSYAWYVNGHLWSTNTQFEWYFNGTGTYVVHLVAYDKNGCASVYSYKFVMEHLPRPDQDFPGQNFHDQETDMATGMVATPPMIAYDRFGTAFNLDDLIIPSNSSLAGFFLLHFWDEDVNNGLGNGMGFDDPGPPPVGSPFATMGEARKEVLIQAFEDISRLLTPNATVGGGSTLFPNPYSIPQLVEIDVRADMMWGSTVATTIPIPSGVLGAGTQYYVDLEPGLAHGEVWKTINTGFDSYYGLTNSYYSGVPRFHGAMAIKFSGINWYMDLDGTPAIGATDNDLYSVVLHEAMHMLGFASSIGWRNYPVTGWGYGGLGYYGNLHTQFDTYLNYGVSNTPVINNSFCFPIFGGSGPFLISGGVNFTGGCNTMFFGGTGLLNNNHMVYSPTTWANGSSCSHFNCPGPVTGYAMNSSTASGVMTRMPHPSEVETLCDLGYIIQPQYGNGQYAISTSATNAYTSACGNPNPNNVAGANDFRPFNVANTGFMFNLQAGQSITFDNFGPNGLLHNDHNAVSFECVQFLTTFSSGSISTSGLGTASASITYNSNANYAGAVRIRYRPINSLGHRGNFTYIFINVEQPVPPCNSCNLVCQGDFENITNAFCSPLNNFSIFVPGFWNSPRLYTYNSGSGNTIMAQMGTSTTPGWGCGPSIVNPPPPPGGGNKYVGLNTMTGPIPGYANDNSPVGLLFDLQSPLNPANSYNITFWARTKDPGCTSYINFVGHENRPCFYPEVTEKFSPTFCGSTGQTTTPVPLGGASIGSSGSGNTTWQQYTVTLSAGTFPANLAYLMVYASAPGPASPAGGSQSFVFIDEIEILSGTTTTYPQIGTGTGKKYGKGVVTTSDGNTTYVAGFFDNNITFPGGPTLTSSNLNVYVIKYGCNGIEWVRHFGTPLVGSAGVEIALDANEVPFVAGIMYSAPVTFDAFTFTSAGSFVLKMDPSNGTVLAANHASDAFATTLEIDQASGEVYVGGNYSNAATFGTTTLTAPTGVNAGFVAKYTNGLADVWANDFHSTTVFDEAKVHAMAVDGLGNIFIGGDFKGVLPFASTTYSSASTHSDGFVLKYSSLGAELAAAVMGGALLDGVRGMAADAAGNCYIGGHFEGTAVNFGGLSLTSTGGLNNFVVKLNTSLVGQWGHAIGALSFGPVVDLDAANNLYVVGRYGGTSTFTGFTPGSLTATGSSEIYVAKVLANGTPDFVSGSTSTTGSNTIVEDVSCAQAGTVMFTGAFFSSGLTFGTLPTIVSNHLDMYVARIDDTGSFFRYEGLEAITSGTFSVKAFPNPFTHHTTLQVQTTSEDPIAIQVFDAKGRIMETRQGLAPHEEIVLEGELSTGMYFVKVRQAGQVVNLKLIKM